MLYKTIILILMLVFSEHTIAVQKTLPKPYINYYPMFLESYSHIRKWEGNYSNIEYDRGGETYAGIARRYNRNWIGWEYLDNFKQDSVLCWNQKIDELEPHVLQYYFDIWMQDGYYKIENQILRDYIFDYRNTGPIAYRHIKQLLTEMGVEGLDSKAVMDEATINGINKVESMIFILRLQDIRRDYYERVADRNPEQRKFLNGWINRANNIIT